jgi:hypothetical protein
MYAVGDILTGKAILTGAMQEYVVTKVNRKSVCFSDGGNVHRATPDEDGILWITHGKYRMVKIQKVVA